jgi:hypothetical protein
MNSSIFNRPGDSSSFAIDKMPPAYVYEKNPRVSPTFANVPGCPGFWAKHPGTGIDWGQAVARRADLAHP